jgi:hypothetical protein
MQQTERFGSVNIEFDAPAAMRDGTILRANIFRPAGVGPWPTLLTRTPYGKDISGLFMLSGVDPVKAARRGFMVIVQDTRGRYASDGVFEPIVFEGQDGYDTVEWAARVPGSNGQVGMYGASYHAYTQWAAAVQRPPSLRAISPMSAGASQVDRTRGGALQLATVGWSLSSGLDYISRLGLEQAEAQRRLDAAIDELDRLLITGYWELPTIDPPPLRRHGLPFLPATSVPDHGETSSPDATYDRVQVPSFHTTGWYDSMVQETLDSYQAMVARGHDARLIVGPWTHVNFADPIGERAFGTRSGREYTPHGGQSIADLQLAWLGRKLAQGGADQSTTPPVRIFVMGRNQWRDEESWPLDRAVPEKWYLGADGVVDPGGPPLQGGATEYIYDPAQPVPTLGGNTVLPPPLIAGSCEQSRIEARDDVCVFTSHRLAKDLEVTGRVRVVLYTESSSPSTDWVARLCDVEPDGRSFNLCEGICRISEGADDCVRTEIDLLSTSNVFLAGHQLRVQITSSCFPQWDRNLNTGDQSSSRMVVARQRLYHGGSRVSHIVLPVISA